MNRIAIILLLVVILAGGVFAIDDQIKALYGLEGKIGFGGDRKATPYGVGGSFRTRLLFDNMKLGAELGFLVNSNWEDTLDLANSPDPQDTALYDIWVNRGTDVSIIVGPRASYEVLGRDNSSIRIDLGLGTLFNISSYDDIKKQAGGTQQKSVSEIESEIEFYFRPRLELQYKKIYAAYNYYFSDNIEHTICFGLMFF